MKSYCSCGKLAINTIFKKNPPLLLESESHSMVWVVVFSMKSVR